MTADTHTLTGAYALDALGEAERRAFQRHLASCPACAQEVAELRATSARLGLAVATTPPADLRARLLAQITAVRQESPLVAELRARRRREPVGAWLTRLSTLAAALAILAACGLGALARHDDGQLDASRAQLAQAQSRYAALAQALSAPDARVVTGRSIAGTGTATAVVSAALNRGVLTVSGMPLVPATATYQAWLIGPSGPRSVGLLDAAGATSAPLPLTGLHGETEIALTVEPAGGSALPTTNPVLLFNLLS